MQCRSGVSNSPCSLSGQIQTMGLFTGWILIWQQSSLPYFPFPAPSPPPLHCKQGSCPRFWCHTLPPLAPHPNSRPLLYQPLRGSTGQFWPADRKCNIPGVDEDSTARKRIFMSADLWTSSLSRCSLTISTPMMDICSPLFW